MWLLQHTPSLTSRQERDLHRVASTSSVQHLSARSFERLRMQRRFVRCDRHRDTIHGTKSLWLHTAFPLHCLCAVCVWVLHLSLAVYTVVAILIAQSLPQLLPPAPGRPRYCVRLILYHARTFDVDRSARAPTGSLHEHIVHERLKAYVCVLYDSPCVSLLLPGLGNSRGGRGDTTAHCALNRHSMAQANKASHHHQSPTPSRAHDIPRLCIHAQGAYGAPTGAVSGAADARRSSELTLGPWKHGTTP